jgi:hypothetical protein
MLSLREKKKEPELIIIEVRPGEHPSPAQKCLREIGMRKSIPPGIPSLVGILDDLIVE